MEKLEHKKFVEQMKLEKIKLLFDLDETLPVAIAFIGDEFITKLFKTYLGLKKNKMYVYILSFILLLTPLRFLIVFSIIYFAISHQLTSISKKMIKTRMMEDEDFYEKMTKDTVVAIASVSKD